MNALYDKDLVVREKEKEGKIAECHFCKKIGQTMRFYKQFLKIPELEKFK